MAKVLVTGVNGFVGKHLTRELANRGHEVTGIGQDSSPTPSVAELLSNYYSCDLTKDSEVADLNLSDIESVISLAGLARVGDSFRDPSRYMDINVKILSVLGEKLLSEKLSPRVIAVSTGAVYDSAQEMPLNEGSHLTNSGSPYVKSKIEMEKAARSLTGRGLACVIVRPFNHTGPGQEQGFLLPDLYQKIRDAKKSGGILGVGNLDTKRDYTDVRDVARAYSELALAPSLAFDTYNICSQLSVSGKNILGWLTKAMDASVQTKIDQALLRPDDPLEIFGTYHRLKQDTGWEPAIPIEKTIEDFVSEQDQRELIAA